MEKYQKIEFAAVLSYDWDLSLILYVCVCIV
jgi:hypothetical protein